MPSPDTRIGGPPELGSLPSQTRDAVLEALADTFSAAQTVSRQGMDRRTFIKLGAGFLATLLLPTACRPIAAQPVPPTVEPPTVEAQAATPVPTIKPAKPTASPQEQATEAYASLVFSSLDRLIKKAKDSQKETLRSQLNAAQVEAFFVLDQKQGGLWPEVYQSDDSLVNFALVSYQDGGLGFLATNIAPDGKTVEGATLIDLKRTLGKVPVLGVDFLSGEPAMVLTETKNGKGEAIVLPALVNANQRFQALTEVNGKNAGYEVGGKIVWEEAKQVASLNILSVNNAPTPLPSPTRPAPASSQEKENIYYPLLKTLDSASVYTGPGNLGYENPATLPKDSQVKVMGVFGDFYKVSYTDKDGKPQKGYVYGKTLDAKELAFNQDFTAQLTLEAVPWQTVKTIGMKGYDNSSSNDWFGKDRAPLKTGEGPFGITINLNSSFGDFPSLSLSGRINSDPNKSWWQDVSRLYIAVQKGKVVMSLRDGRSESSSVNIDLPKLPAGQTFSLVFSDAQGKKFTLVDNSGKAIGEVNVTQYGNFPNGLFPDKKLYPGMLISPKASLAVNQLSLTTPPSGHFGEAATEGRFTSEFPALPNNGLPPDYYGFSGTPEVYPVKDREGNTKAYSIEGVNATISLDSSKQVVQLTMTTDKFTGIETSTYTIVPSNTHSIQFAGPYQIEKIEWNNKERGYINSLKFSVPPGWEPTVFSSADPDEITKAFNYYINFLKSHGIANPRIELVSLSQNFSPDENGVFKIAFIYPSFSQ